MSYDVLPVNSGIQNRLARPPSQTKRFWSRAVLGGAIALCVTFLCGCMTVGRAYVSPKPGSLVLNAPREQMVNIFLGVTSKHGNVTPSDSVNDAVNVTIPRAFTKRVNETPNGTFEVLESYMVHANLGGAKGKALNLEFLDGRLHGFIEVQIATKGMNSDALMELGLVPPIDGSRVEALKTKGSALTKDDLLRGLGDPHGKALRNSTLKFFGTRPKTAAETWAWNTSKPIKASDGLATIAFATLDDQGRVTNLEVENVTPDE